MPLDDAVKFGLRAEVLSQLREAGITEFTTAQIAAIKKGLCKGKSLVIASPTSTGKTLIAEIAALHGAINNLKTIYLVTHKALAEEKYEYFKRQYGSADNKWFDVSIATGDRNEGDWTNGILVATYEKYLGLLSSSETYSFGGKIVIADEIQILSDNTRGADVEVLCSIIKQSLPAQIIALSATAPNVDEIAGWLNCLPIKVALRDVPLRQEVWKDSKRYYSHYGIGDVIEDKNNKIVSSDTLTATKKLVSTGMGPVLVFTMTRPRAIELAQQFSESRKQAITAFGISDQLDLFTEPTQISSMLRKVVEKRVAFHSADLSFDERSVIEMALRERKLDVVFSTPTLAAGVNFPIKTVLFDCFSRYSGSKNTWIQKSEYFNMSGRAGRLGLDKEGYAILMPKNKAESIQANEYISSGSDPLRSVLLSRSVRKSVLHLISIHICRSEDDLNKFYSSTLWWFQTRKRNSKKLSQIGPLITSSLVWLEQNKLIQKSHDNFSPTLLGKTISGTGLLPSTGIFLLSLLKTNKKVFSDDKFELPLIHAVCCSDEYDEQSGQRFLPFSKNNKPESIAMDAISSQPYFVKPFSPKCYDKVTNAAYAVYLWSKGESDSALRRAVPPISYGYLHSLSSDVAWILDGLHKISLCSGIKFSYAVPAQINLLAQTVRFGVVRDALDVLRSANSYRVPGLGRQRAMALAKNRLSEPNVLIHSNINSIAKLVQGKDRAQKIIEAVSHYYSDGSARWMARHLAQSKERDLIALSYEAIGHDYEDVIEQIVRQIGWKIKKLDSAKRQGVPDFEIIEGGKSILVECKTKKRDDAAIDKDDAFDVLTKGVDFDADHYITIGKPDFDFFSKSKAAGSTKITLVANYSFIAAFLRWKEGKLKAIDFFSWLTTPGVASIENLREQ